MEKTMYFDLSRYTIDTLNKIPTGSLYFASRRGPLSEASLKITGSPYDLIGIIFQSNTIGKEGTYIYTIDQNFNNGNKVIIINLAYLIKDNNIIHHGVLPLKDSDSKIILILQQLFKNYKTLNLKCDVSQNLASILGLSRKEENNRSKNYYTGPELIGYILFKAGLISSDKITNEVIVSFESPNKERHDWFKDESDIRVENNIRFYLEENSKSSRDIFFESLRTIDFLIDTNIDSWIKEFLPVSGKDEKLVVVIQSLANHNSHNVNKLNMIHYHGNLIPIELQKDNKFNCENYDEYRNLKSLVSQLNENFSPKNLSDLDSDRLLKICKRTSKLSENLHRLSQECGVKIKYNNYQNRECRLKVLLDSENKHNYKIIMQEYMWNNNWKYILPDSINYRKNLSCQIKKLISKLIDLRDHIPISCTILNIVNYQIEQAHELYTYTIS
jgi:hypothetical protein